MISLGASSTAFSCLRRRTTDTRTVSLHSLRSSILNASAAEYRWHPNSATRFSFAVSRKTSERSQEGFP